MASLHSDRRLTKIFLIEKTGKTYIFTFLPISAALFYLRLATDGSSGKCGT